MIRTLSLLLLLACANVFAAPVTVTLSGPTTLAAGGKPTLTWSSTGAAFCVASDGWSGTKAVNGTEILPAITSTTKWTLTCTSATGPITATWTPPTTNTDGSPLTNLTGYKIAYNANANVDPPATLITLTNPALTSTVFEAPPGKQYFVMRATAGAIESERTAIVSYTVVADTAAKSLTTTVPPVATKPAQPTNFTVTGSPSP